MSDEQPEQAAWEDRCRDCDNAGVTIQTERRCACQPPFQVEQPKQWARELFDEAYHQTHLNGKRFAALTIQRDFAEREAEMVGALEFIASEGGQMESRIAAATLKSREAGHG